MPTMTDIDALMVELATRRLVEQLKQTPVSVCDAWERGETLSCDIRVSILAAQEYERRHGVPPPLFNQSIRVPMQFKAVEA